MENIYFLDVNRISIDDFLKLEYIAALEAAALGWKLFVVMPSKSIGKTSVSLN